MPISATRRLIRRARYGKPIVVVSGLPRSGTSMMMQMLEAGGVEPLTDGARRADADNPRGYYELEAVKGLARDASCLADAGGRAVKVVHALVRALPPEHSYRAILMERDLAEVLDSQDRMLARRGAHAAPLPRARLAGILRAQLDEAAAWLEARPNVCLLRVRHAEAIRDPAAVAARLAAHLGGGFDVAAAAAVVDPTLHRARGGA